MFRMLKYVAVVSIILCLAFMWLICAGCALIEPLLIWIAVPVGAIGYGTFLVCWKMLEKEEKK